MTRKSRRGLGKVLVLKSQIYCGICQGMAGAGMTFSPAVVVKVRQRGLEIVVLFSSCQKDGKSRDNDFSAEKEREAVKCVA